MKCANCSVESSDSSMFCQNCGQPFESPCPNCGVPVTSGAHYCGNCGFDLSRGTASGARLARLQQAAPGGIQTQVLATPRQIEGERKQVTVLFSDIVGSTSLAETMDPEDWGEIVSGAHESVSTAVYRYEGTIAQLLGDGVLAFFGAPVAHEDDPVRAVNAGLDLLNSIARYSLELARKSRVNSFRMRVGLNTGLVVVGNIGTDMHMEYLAVGDTVNLAARLQSSAEPGTILISENTARLVKHAFDLEPKGLLELKGKAAPVPAYRVISRKARMGSARGIEGLNSPLVGRERELASLQNRLDQLRNGQGHIVAVMGEAGLGKSRLVADAKKASQSEGNSDLTWLEGRSLSFETNTPYAPFRDLFERLFGLSAQDLDAAKYAKIKRWLDELGPGLAGEIAPYLGSLMGIQIRGEDATKLQYLIPPDLRGQVSMAVMTLFGRMAAQRPLVLVLDDLHWADVTSLDLVQQLLPLAARSPFLLLTLLRPQHQEPSWRFQELASTQYPENFTPITLQPLDQVQSRELVANLLHIEHLPEQVRALILKKAEGNPFFVEEVIRSLLDTKLVIKEDGHWRATREIENVSVPDTLAGVIAARLDRLDEETKKTAQTASVIGREFQLDLLSEISSARQNVTRALATLEQRELVLEKAHVPEIMYRFKHALTQETAYASLLNSKRREIHRRVAEYLEQSDPTRVNEIAGHLFEAQEFTRALPYLVEAGERAAHAYATPEAIRYYRQALDILQAVDDPNLARRAYEGLGGALSLANDIPGAVRTYEAMLDLGEENKDAPMQVSAMNKLASTVALRMGQFPEAEKRLSQAEQIARTIHDRHGLAELYLIRCQMCSATADFAGAVNYMSQTVELARELNIKEQLAYGLGHIASTLVLMTRFDEAFPVCQESLQITREIGNLEHEADSLIMAATPYHLRNGDLDQAAKTAEQGTDISLRIGLAFGRVLGPWAQAEIARLRGEYERAIELDSQSLHAGRRMQSFMPWLCVLPLGALGLDYLGISDKLQDRAATYHSEALELLKLPTGMPAGGTGWADIGWGALAVGDLATAADLFHKGLTLPSIHGLLQKPRLFAGAAQVALEKGELAAAHDLLGQARAFMQERKMKNVHPLVDLIEGKLALGSGRALDAVDAFQRSENLAKEMMLRPIVWQAQVGQAEALSRLGRMEETNTKIGEAGRTVNEIAALFHDIPLRELFLESAQRQLVRALSLVESLQ